MLGDFHSGSRIRPIVVNIHIDDQGELQVGVGYHILSPSTGKIVASSGWTWEDIPDQHRSTLTTSIHALLDAVVDAEGLSGWRSND